MRRFEGFTARVIGSFLTWARSRIHLNLSSKRQQPMTMSQTRTASTARRTFRPPTLALRHFPHRPM